jgi:hypothetical protein
MVEFVYNLVVDYLKDRFTGVSKLRRKGTLPASSTLINFLDTVMSISYTCVIRLFYN